MPKILAKNRRATFDYDLIKKYEAGLVLKGMEVKSVKNGHASLKGSFVIFHNGELFLTNAHISPYKFAGNLKDYDPTASRKLLLHKKEIKYLLGKSKTEGLTMVPLSLYTVRNKIKLEFALARGKKKFDKREDLKKRTAQREISRRIKNL